MHNLQKIETLEELKLSEKENTAKFPDESLRTFTLCSNPSLISRFPGQTGILLIDYYTGEIIQTFSRKFSPSDPHLPLRAQTPHHNYH